MTSTAPSFSDEPVLVSTVGAAPGACTVIALSEVNGSAPAVDVKAVDCAVQFAALAIAACNSALVPVVVPL